MAYRFSLCVAVLIFGASCATPAIESPLPPPAAVATPLEPAALDLTGMTPDQVRRALGTPDIARDEGAGILFTYRREACVLLMVFTGAAGSDLRLADARSAPARIGEAALPLEACVASMRSRMGQRREGDW